MLWNRLKYTYLISENIFSPLSHMPISGSSNLAANKKICQKYGQIGIQLSD